MFLGFPAVLIFTARKYLYVCEKKELYVLYVFMNIDL